MKRFHTLIVTLICMAAFAAFSFGSLSYGAELPGAAGRETSDFYDMSETKFGSEVTNLRTAISGTCGNNVSWTLNDEGTLTISGTGKMENYAFFYPSPWYDIHSSVKTVEISSGVTSIGSDAFYECDSLQSITIPSSVTSIGFEAFYGCSSLQSITIPSSVTSIGFEIFHGCIKLESIEIPSGVTSIEGASFYECTSLQSITIPSSVTSIGDSAFSYCESLQNITIPSGVTSIGKTAFGHCDSLQSITIPSGVTSIESRTFESCTNLKSIIIPSSVETIGDEAFNKCDSLEAVYYNGSDADWGKIISSLGTYNNPLQTNDIVHTNQIFATGVSLNKESLALAPGKTETLSAVIIPEEAILEKTIIWSSADPKIAKVDDNGTVTAVAEGETIVTAMSALWGYSANCSVMVKKTDGTDDGSSGGDTNDGTSDGNTDSSKRKKPANTFVGGQKVDVKTLYFSSHPEATRFQSSSKKIASVSKKGIMKAKKPGNVTIEAQTGKKKAERKTVSSCSLTILDRPKLKFKAKYSASTDIGKVLDGYEFFSTESTKQTAADLWESSKPAVAEITPETGTITIKGKGTTTITAYFGKKGEKGTLKVKAKLKVKK